MKKLLFLTDFSANATHAAEYGYNLARQIGANIVLCNVVNIAAESPQATLVSWSDYEYDTLLEESKTGLKQLSEHLEAQGGEGFKPAISAVNKDGTVSYAACEVANEKDVDMVIMSTHNSDGLTTFMFGNHARAMIDTTTKPLLLIPAEAKALPIKKIAFATDFKQPEDDLETIFILIRLAKRLNAEILIAHTHTEKHPLPSFKKWLDNLLVELSNKADYPNIYYRVVESRNPETGLDWLCQHGQIDMLAMPHRPRSFFDGLINGSHTQNMAGHIPIPLLVFPAKV